MKTIVYQGPRQMVMEEAEVPKPGPGEAVIKVESVGICGSELEGYLGLSSVRVPPLVMGHEFCGTIAELHSSAAVFAIGDKVTVNPLVSCGSCRQCRAGQRNICPRRELIGIHRPGAFAEYVTVPVHNLYTIPNKMDSSLAALAEPLAVGIHAVKLGLKPFGDVMIYGAGTIGLLVLQAARNMGANNILVVEKQPSRIRIAEQLGAVVAAPEEAEKLAAELFGPDGVDTIIDCVGVSATREQAMKIIHPGGNIIMVGLGHKETMLPMDDLVRKEVSLLGSYSYTDEDFNQSVQQLIAGNINMEHWVDHRHLSEGPQAFQALIEGQLNVSKIILKP